MGRPRIHDDNTRERLYRAAEAMVAEKGAEALSVRRLAQAADTTTRAVYSVFGGKDGILRALYRETWVTLMQRIAQVPMTRDPQEDLVRAGLDFRWFATHRPNLFRLVFHGRRPAPMLTRDDLAVAFAARAELRRRVQRCADEELLGGRSVDQVTNQFHALCQGLAANELDGWLIPFRDPTAVWEDALRALVHGMAVAPTRGRRPKARRARARSGS